MSIFTIAPKIQLVTILILGLLVFTSCQKKQAVFDPVDVQEVMSLESHDFGYISDIAFSPDGKTLASGSRQTIKLWEVATGKNIATLEGNEFLVFGIAFSPDGKTLASGGGDKAIKLWEVATGKNISTLEGHDDRVASVAFSPDGKTLASGSGDETIKLWEVATGKNISTLEGHTSYVSSVAFSPDGKTLASGSGDNTIKLWAVETGKNIATFEGHEDYVSSVAFSPDGKTLASGGGDKAIKLWQPASVREASLIHATPDQEVRRYVASLDKDSENACEPATDLMKAGLSLRGLGSAKVDLLKAGALGDKSSLEVSAKVTAIMTEAGFEATTTLSPNAGMEVIYEKDSTYYELAVLDSGLFAEAKVVCWFQVK